MNRAKLSTLNAARWIRENIWIWGVLTVIYSFTLALILQSVLEFILKRELSWRLLWPMTWAGMLIPWLLHRVPMGSLPVRVPSLNASPFVDLFLRHELRRPQNFLSVAVALALLVSLPEQWGPVALVAALIPSQQGLYSIQGWTRLALASNPQHGARYLVFSFALLQLILGVILLISWALAGVIDPTSGGVTLWNWAAPFVGAWIAASCVALEGDAGRPWIVNFMSMAAGLVAGFIAVIHPVFVFVIAYFAVQMVHSVKERLRSVEFIDEDSLIP